MNTSQKRVYVDHVLETPSSATSTSIDMMNENQHIIVARYCYSRISLQTSVKVAKKL